MAEFFYMDGYAIYVWGSFAATALVFAWNAYEAAASRSRVRKKVKLLKDD